MCHLFCLLLPDIHRFRRLLAAALVAQSGVANTLIIVDSVAPGSVVAKVTVLGNKANAAIAAAVDWLCMQVGRTILKRSPFHDLFNPDLFIYFHVVLLRIQVVVPLVGIFVMLA